MSSSFVLNPLLEREIRAEAGVHRLVDDRADAALEYAEEHVAVESGELKASLHLEDAPDGGRRLVAGTDHWQYVEFGTIDDPAQPYLRPASQAVGLAIT